MNGGSTLKTKIGDLPTKFFVCCALLLIVISMLPSVVLAPLQLTNQVMANGAVSTATITDSYTTGIGSRNHRQHVSFSYLNTMGETVYGSDSQSVSKFGESWDNGALVPIHYLNGTHVLGNKNVWEFDISLTVFSVAMVTLLWVILSSCRPGPKARDKFEAEILRPRLPRPDIRFNPETNRSEVLTGERGVDLTSYSTLLRSPDNGKHLLPSVMAIVFAIFTVAIMLSQLTLAVPSPDFHVLALVIAQSFCSLACLIFAGWSYQLYLEGLNPEIEDELERRRFLIASYREHGDSRKGSAKC